MVPNRSQAKVASTFGPLMYATGVYERVLTEPTSIRGHNWRDAHAPIHANH